VDQETDKIKQHIDAERERLGRNINEIEDRVKDAVDFKTQFRRNTGLFLGGAVAVGFLLSRAMGRSGPRISRLKPVRERNENVMELTSSRLGSHLSRVSETFDNILGGLANVASDKLYSVVGDMVPGLRDRLNVRGTQTGRAVYH